MYCRKCGAENADGVRFCKKCGEKLIAIAGNEETNKALEQKIGSPPEEIEKSAEKPEKKSIAEKKAGKPGPKRRHRAIKTTIIILSVILVLGVAGGFAYWKLKPAIHVNSFSNMIEEQDLSSAISAYDEMTFEEKTDANSWMEAYIAGIKEQYYNEEYDYSTANAILSSLVDFYAVAEIAEDAIEEITEDNRCMIAFQTATKSAEAKDWEKAYQQLKQIDVSFRKYDEVSALTKECITNYRESILDACKAYAENNQYKKLMQAMDEALTVLPDDTELSVSYQEYLDEFIAKTLASAADSAASGDYDAAITTLEEGRAVYYSSELENAEIGYKVQQAISEANAYADNQNYEGAISRIREAVYDVGAHDAELNEALERYCDSYVEQVLTNAKSYAESRDFESAIQILETARSFYEADEFSEMIAAYEASLPIKLADCHVIEKNYWISVGTDATDCFGTEYSNVIRAGVFPGDATFYLAGNYVNLSGVFAVEESSADGVKSWCNIYADDVLIYESGEIGRTSGPVSISLDVTGVQQLRVVLDNDGGGLGYKSEFLDATLS